MRIIVAFKWLTFFAPYIQIGIYREPFSLDAANKNGSKAVLAGAPQFAQ